MIRLEAGERTMDISQMSACCRVFGLALSTFCERVEDRLREEPR